MKMVTANIKSNIEIAKNTYEMILQVPAGMTDEINAGRFINVKLDGFYLRRPISICDWDSDSITVIYKVVGRGTEAMSQMKEGCLNILVPLGNGYTEEFIKEAGSNPVVIGGGAGVPPMFGLCKELTARGSKVTAVLGWGSADEIFYIDEFKEAGAEVVVATADGSYGVKGFVTDALQNIACTSFFACGPEVMLKAIDNQIDEGVPGWCSFEERMGCGFGACMGCSCKTKYGNKRICKDGPVLEREEIIW